MTTDPALDDYIASHIDPEPDHLRRLSRDTYVECLYPNMCSGHAQGRLLKMLVRLARPRRVLELGTFTGYSAQCLAEGLTDPDAEIHTVEINDEMADFITRHLDASPAAGRVTLHTGPAEEIVPALPGEWDMVFIDANKRRYADYYRMVLPRVVSGGIIVADNTLWYGKVTDPAVHDPQTEGIREFNDLVAADTSVEKVFIPVRDGLTVIYKK